MFPALILFRRVEQISTVSVIILLSASLQGLSFLFAEIQVAIVFLPSRQLFAIGCPIRDVSAEGQSVGL